MTRYERCLRKELRRFPDTKNMESFIQKLVREHEKDKARSNRIVRKLKRQLRQKKDVEV